MHPSEPQARRNPNHRRTRPELNINTLHANDADTFLDPELSTPLSPPPLINNHSPAIPTKSSQRSLRSASHEKRHPPASSSKGKQAAAPRQAVAATINNGNKLSGQNSKVDRDRTAQERLKLDRDREHAKESGLETSLDTISPVDMSNKENDFPSDTYFDSHSQRDSHTPPPMPQHLRDSHDLSLSPRNVTRDSLLGNMLMSLDQFSMGQLNSIQSPGATRTMSGFGDPSTYQYYDEDGGARSRTMTSTIRAPRPSVHGNRGHTYSYSSDYEAPDDSSRVSSNLSRGRRSNSSSTGFQSNLGRINSMCEKPNQRVIPGTPGSRALHSRGRKGSKSSSTNSIDPGYAQVLGSQRWAHGLGGGKRSSSFELVRPQSLDTVTQPHEQHQNQQKGQREPWHVEFSNSFFTSTSNNSTTDPFDYDLDDAAPTPTVPAGPRRLATMPSMPSFPRSEPMGEPLSPVRSVNVNLERKRSNKSSRSTNTNATRQSHHSSRFNTRDNAPPPPLPGPVPVPDLTDSAPAPHVGYEKAKEHVHPAAPNPPVPQPKEKPGFFRRMFGGGTKNSVVAALDQSATSSVLSNSTINSPAAAAAAPNATNMNNLFSHQQSASHQQQSDKPNSNPPSRQTNSSHGLQKKPSGFFRRRKKSVSVTNADAPPLPTSLPPPMLLPAELPLDPPKRIDLLTPRPQPSPVTSLRKAMDPYLKGSVPSSGQASPSTGESVSPSVYHSAVEEINQSFERNQRGFSPDYEPDPKALIRSVPSESRLGVETQHPSPDFPKPATVAQEAFKPPYNYERTGSFLHDNSESEDSPPRVRKPAATNNQSMSPRGAARASLAPLQTDLPLSSPSSNNTIRDKKLDRLTQDSMSTDKSDRPSSLTLPIEGVRTDSGLKTRASAASIPSFTIEDATSNSKVTTPKPENPLDEPEFVIGDPTEDERAKAQKIFDGNEDFIPKEKAASWMGEEGPIRQRTLRAYIDLYDFTNKNVVTCLRDVCNRLIFRAETQQVDRVLVAFSTRWCDCNPNHGFKSIGTSPSTICITTIITNPHSFSFNRCHPHHLLFHHATEYRPSLGRH